MKSVLVIDNYDSFTYNLVALLSDHNDVHTTVIRNDKANINVLSDYDAFVFSPGPGIPQEAGALLQIIARYYSSKPMLGVCLGLQAIGETFGAQLYNLSEVYHGVQTAVTIHTKNGLFAGLPDQIQAGRYHSWALTPDTIPDSLTVTATDGSGVIMGVSHKTLPVHGVQFHPESIMTPEGKFIVQNFLKRIS